MSETIEEPPGGAAAGVAAITLFVEDLDGSKDFYRRAFERPIVFEDANSVVFMFGTTAINLLHVSAAPELIEPATVASPHAGSRAVMTINVADVDGVCARLEAAGIRLLNGPMDRPWGPRTASFADPAGHIWEIARS